MGGSGDSSSLVRLMMSDKLRLDVSAPAHGLFKVALKRISGETIDFEYILSGKLLLNPFLTIKL
jgi:hypothetical protein